LEAWLHPCPAPLLPSPTNTASRSAMGKKKPFIDRGTSRHFHLINTDRTDLLTAEDAGKVNGRDDEHDLGEGIAQLRVGDGNGDDGDCSEEGGDHEGDASAEEYDEFGFTRDGYDYSKHMRERGGGMWVPAAYGEGAKAEPSALPADAVVLKDEVAADEDATGSLVKADGLAIVRADVDVGDMDEDILAALEMPGIKLRHSNGLVAAAEVEREEAAATETESGVFPFGDLPDNFVEVIHRRGLRTKKRKKLRRDAQRDRELDDLEDEDEDDSSDGGSYGRPGYNAQAQPPRSRAGGSRAGGSSRWGGSQATTRRDAETNAFLEKQLTAVLDQYDDDEIGELDQDDERVRGQSELSDFDAIMEAHLREQALPTIRGLYGAHGSVGGGDAPEAAREEGANGGAVTLASHSVSRGDGVDQPVPLSSAAKERLALVPEDEDADEELDAHPFLSALATDDAGQEQWDAETILTTYTNTENHPKLLSVRPSAKKGGGIKLSKQGLPVGIMGAAEVKAAFGPGAPKVLFAPPRDAVDDRGSESGSDDGGDDGTASVLGGSEGRNRTETADEKRARKAAVKAERRARRGEKKQTKELFTKEKTNHLKQVSQRQPVGLQI